MGSAVVGSGDAGGQQLSLPVMWSACVYVGILVRTSVLLENLASLLGTKVAGKLAL